MKTYVMIARHLGTVSGEKIYTYNKMRYMLSQGWRVLFLSGKRETTPCDDNTNYSHFVYPPLTYAPECYTRREVFRTIENIVSVIENKDSDQCIIESDRIERAVWAELIASRIGAKHLALLLQESHHYDAETRAFLKFKYDRHELAGISVKSINQMLGDSIQPRDDTRFAAYCNNSVEDCEDLISPKLYQEAKYTFGCLGRLDKKCVPAILDAIVEYISNYPDEQYNLVLIGGSLNGDKEKTILDIFHQYTNIHVFITGFLYPVPASLIKRIDLFISTAGSANLTYRFHRPTIRVHPITGEPSGILGLDDLSGKTMYDVMGDTTVKDCMVRALSEADRIEYIYNYYDDYFEKMNVEFARQVSFASIIQQKEYYDEELLLKIKTTRIKGHQLHRVLGHCIGAEGLNRTISLMRKIYRLQ